ncbi:MAG: hypothetical protein ACK58T_45690, partial [Phycisphaerae bacterium]
MIKNSVNFIIVTLYPETVSPAAERLIISEDLAEQLKRAKPGKSHVSKIQRVSVLQKRLVAH